jgi:hypothetical protein
MLVWLRRPWFVVCRLLAPPLSRLHHNHSSSSNAESNSRIQSCVTSLSDDPKSIFAMNITKFIQERQRFDKRYNLIYWNGCLSWTPFQSLVTTYALSDLWKPKRKWPLKQQCTLIRNRCSYSSSPVILSPVISSPGHVVPRLFCSRLFCPLSGDLVPGYFILGHIVPEREREKEREIEREREKLILVGTFYWLVNFSHWASEKVETVNLVANLTN